MRRWLKILVEAAKAWNDDNAFKHSAAVSFYTLFSLAPVTIIAVSVAGFFFGEDVASKQLSGQMSQLIGPTAVEVLQRAMATQTLGDGVASTIMGLALMIFSATTVFAQLQDSLNTIWGVKATPARSGWIILVIQRLISFAMVITVGFLLLTSLVLSTALTAALNAAKGWVTFAPWVLHGADLGVGLVIITSLFALMFKVLPDVVVKWGEVWIGAFVTAALFTLGRFVIALYLGHTTVASAYGAAGSLVALLLWIYYSCAILFYGAEFIRAYRIDRGEVVQPKSTAVIVRLEIVQKPDGKEEVDRSKAAATPGENTSRVPEKPDRLRHER